MKACGPTSGQGMNEYLRLLAEHNVQGVQASIYNVISKTWMAPSKSVENFKQGKARAEAHARECLNRSANVELPALQWKASRSAQACRCAAGSIGFADSRARFRTIGHSQSDSTIEGNFRA